MIIVVKRLELEVIEKTIQVLMIPLKVTVIIILQCLTEN